MMRPEPIETPAAFTTGPAMTPVAGAKDVFEDSELLKASEKNTADDDAGIDDIELASTKSSTKSDAELIGKDAPVEKENKKEKYEKAGGGHGRKLLAVLATLLVTSGVVVAVLNPDQVSKAWATVTGAKNDNTTSPTLLEGNVSSNATHGFVSLPPTTVPTHAPTHAPTLSDVVTSTPSTAAPSTTKPTTVAPTPSVSSNSSSIIVLPAAKTDAPVHTTPTVTTVTPKPTTETPKPTTVTPKPTTETPKPTTETPKPTTETPKPTTETPKPTTKTPAPTSASTTTQEVAGHIFVVPTNSSSTDASKNATAPHDSVWGPKEGSSSSNSNTSEPTSVPSRWSHP
ncbi:hypothetical protein SPRG_02248 [Saprolegnia parasitica CBS 223.65]|uniref:Uncharacterized protein n=1 Tax=Saprolegnia parasitica (strain CBS 223.65) TaxID=695850 RepID=A0A067D3W1_SAPPC|nr:hypothetical protein SPRG_02248 [Saprolegnia parasitica CBS 223.65]KDO33441.1 hypothetical protein SPRG_02248 [Saprolegnia parasitica CBS 223.65]|eukprot:XP_012196187.1 hypothetical protein SPRG_02248 [Saprolegnia parasitica CBS 223.65]